METGFIKELNDALDRALPTPKSKNGELVPKIAARLHILEELFLIARRTKTNVSGAISLQTLEKALYFVDNAQQQEIFLYIKYFYLILI